MFARNINIIIKKIYIYIHIHTTFWRLHSLSFRSLLSLEIRDMIGNEASKQMIKTENASLCLPCLTFTDTSRGSFRLKLWLVIFLVVWLATPKPVYLRRICKGKSLLFTDTQDAQFTLNTTPNLCLKQRPNYVRNIQFTPKMTPYLGTKRRPIFTRDNGQFTTKMMSKNTHQLPIHTAQFSPKTKPNLSPRRQPVLD